MHGVNTSHYSTRCFLIDVRFMLMQLTMALAMTESTLHAGHDIDSCTYGFMS